MDIKQLRYFVAVAELGSFSRASQTLHVAQPALSRHIQQLERETKVQLFQRSARGVVTTPTGARLLRRAHSILEQMEDLKSDIRSENKETQMTVTLGMPIAVMAVLAPHLHAYFAENLPAIQFKLVEGFSAFLHEWLISGSVDIALLYTTPDAAITHTPLVTEELYLIGPATPELRAKAFAAGDEIGRLPLILPHRPHPTWDALDLAGIQVSNHVPADALGRMVDLIRNGTGYAVLSTAAVQQHLSNDELVAIPIRSPMVRREVSICRASFRARTRRFTTMYDLIGAEIRNFALSGGWPGGAAVNQS